MPLLAAATIKEKIGAFRLPHKNHIKMFSSLKTATTNRWRKNGIRDLALEQLDYMVWWSSDQTEQLSRDI